MAAVADARTTFVTTCPLIACTVPPPLNEPPEASTVLVASESSWAVSSALTVTLPAVSVTLSTYASEAARRSFMTTRIPIARALDGVRLPMFG